MISLVSRQLLLPILASPTCNSGRMLVLRENVRRHVVWPVTKALVGRTARRGSRWASTGELILPFVCGYGVDLTALGFRLAKTCNSSTTQCPISPFTGDRQQHDVQVQRSQLH
jgi:hypothetical protein